MTACKHRVASAVAAVWAAMAVGPTWAHSASDAYLTFNVEKRIDASGAKQTTLHGQWDIALRDLDFVMQLDDNGDGNITWSELQRHQAAIAAYVYPRLKASSGGAPCTVTPAGQLVADHADGAYAALFFDIVCKGTPKPVTLDYRLFFDIDPSHRGILVMRSGDDTSTSLLSPDNARVDLKP